MKLPPRALWHLATRAFTEHLYYDPEDPQGSTLVPGWAKETEEAYNESRKENS